MFLYDYLVFNFFLLISLNKIDKSNKLNTLHSISVDKIAIPPPMQAVKNGLSIVNVMFDTKCPNRLEGKIIKVYLNVILNRFMDKFGITDFIFLKFKSVITPIDKKNEITTELMPMSGVVTTKLTSNTTEPKI